MSANDRAIETLRREIAKLQTDGAAIARKHAGIRTKLASAMAAQAKAKTASALRLKQAEASRLEKELMAASKSQADIATKIAKKQSSLSAKLVVQANEANEAKKADAKAKKNYEKVSKTQEEATRKPEAGYRKLTLENQSLEQRLQRELSAMKPTAGPTTNADLTSAPPHDIFISHAWEDKSDFVGALAHTLRAAGAEENWLTSHGNDIRGVIAQNDEMALGAIEAIRAARMDVNSFAIAGVDGVTDALNAVKEGTMDSILQDGEAQALGAIDVAIKAVLPDYEPMSDVWEQYPSMPWNDGADGEYLVPWTPVTAENVDALLATRQ